MSNKVMNINEKLKLHDSNGFGLHGEVIFGRGLHQVEYTDPYGNHATRSEFDQVEYKAHNIIPIGSYQWVFSKMFNIAFDTESTLRVGDLNGEAPQMKIGVPRAEYKSIHYDSETGSGLTPIQGVKISALDYIFGFMIGDGGAQEDNMTSIAPSYKTRSLFHAIPFRMSNDGFDFDATKYFGKSQSYSGVEQFDSYFIKKFDYPAPRIIHAWVSNNPNELDVVDDTVFSATSSLAIESYVEINFSIDASDTRGYYTQTNSTPRVNEFGLVSGWYNAEAGDYENLVLNTAFTRPTISLIENDRISGIYRIYAR